MQAAAPSPEVQAEALVARYLTPTTDDAHTAWTDAYADDVVQRRAATAGSALFVDHWLKEAGLTGTLGLSHAADLFPPRSLSDLFVLVVELLSCAAEAPTRQALLLYLALEPVAVPTPLPDAVRDLAHSLSMSQGEINDVTAYWAVDRGHLEVRRTSPYASLLLERLATAPKLLLPLVQLHQALPPLNAPLSEAALHSHTLVVVAQAQVEGLVPAWHTCRALIEAQPASEVSFVRETLLGALLGLCFAPPQPDLIRSLLLLPLHRDEEALYEAWTQAHLPRTSSAVALDTLLIKWVSQGRYVEAIHLDRRSSQRERANEPGEAHQRARQRRRTMMDGVWALLPAIQRHALREQDADQPMDDAPTDEPSPVPRPHTPLSVSLGTQDQAARAASPDARLLRTSIRMPTAASSQRATASPVPHNVSNEPFRASPFSGWKRPGPVRTPSLTSNPSWGVPVPASSPPRQKDVDTSMEPEPAAMRALPDEPMPEPSASPPAPPVTDTQATVPRRRGRQRSAAKRAAAALRKTLRPEDAAPTIPGGFPMETEPSSPPRRVMPRRSGRRSRATTPADDALRTSSTFSPASLAHPKASRDSRPIARRTRAQTAELESHDSPSSVEMEGSGEVEAEAPGHARRRRERVPASPPQATRTSRRLRRGTMAPSSTPRSTGR